MKTIKQLIRQPLKTFSGILLIALAAAILCTSIGQATAAQKMQENMDYTFVSTGLPTTKFQKSEITQNVSGYVFTYENFDPVVPEEIDQWICSLAQDHPECVKLLSQPKLASAYVEGLVQDNQTKYIDGFYTGVGDSAWGLSLWPMDSDGPTSCAMLEVQLEEIAPPESWYNWKGFNTVPTSVTEKIVSVPIKATVLRAIGLQEGYQDPVGRTAHLVLNLPSLDVFTKLNLQPGERYLVYGDQYIDADWNVRSGISSQCNNMNLLDALEPERVEIYGWYHKREGYKGLGGHDLRECGRYYAKTSFKELDESELDSIDAICMTLEDSSTMPNLTLVNDPEGRYYLSSWDRYEIAEDGTKTPMTQAEYEKRYSIPTIAHLTGTAEEFLASPEGALWQETLDEIHINHSSFPVLAVDRLGYVPAFAKDMARIVDGRDFTKEELESGAKVCVISELTAALSGLKVGDTISPRFYNWDRSSPYQTFINGTRGSVNPTPWLHGRTTPWAGEAEPYKIVGTYRLKGMWAADLHSFTPNTIFVPKNAMDPAVNMDTSNQGTFRTLVIQNGAMRDFQVLVANSGYDGLFDYYDHGYSKIAGNLHNFRAVAVRALEIGCVIYGAMVLLFLLLFPAQQKKNVIIMDSLGTERKKSVLHVLLNSLGMLVPGTVLGVLTGALLWEKVTAAMSSETMVLALPLGTVMAVALVQLLLAAVLVFLVALPITKPRSLGDRK